MYSLSIYSLHQDLKTTHSDSDVWSKCCQFWTQQACQLTKQTENTCKNIRNNWIGSILPLEVDESVVSYIQLLELCVYKLL